MGFKKSGTLPADDFRFGIGYTVGVTLRKDLRYLPIPVIAPLFSTEYK